MEQCPDRVAVAVFVSALMPATGKPMAFVFEQVTKWLSDCCVEKTKKGSNFTLTHIS
jgi:hypothetical protein